MSQLNDLLVFWYGSIPEGSEHHDMEYVMKWFTGGEQADNEIRERFTDLFEQAKRGELDDWANESTFHKLGLIILFDQFTRSQHRGSSEAFAYDSRALDLAKSIYPSETFDQLPSMCKLTVLLPFCHSENLQD